MYANSPEAFLIQILKMVQRHAPATRQGRLSSNQNEKLRIAGTSSTSKSECDEDHGSQASPSNLTILEDLQLIGKPKRSQGRTTVPAPAKKFAKKKDVELGDDDCTAGFILDAIVDTTNPLKENQSNGKKTRGHSGGQDKDNILKDLAASAELLSKDETNASLSKVSRRWIFAVIVVLAISAIGLVIAAIQRGAK